MKINTDFYEILHEIGNIREMDFLTELNLDDKAIRKEFVGDIESAIKDDVMLHFRQYIDGIIDLWERNKNKPLAGK